MSAPFKKAIECYVKESELLPRTRITHDVSRGKSHACIRLGQITRHGWAEGYFPNPPSAKKLYDHALSLPYIDENLRNIAYQELWDMAAQNSRGA